jgi:hypothetical protein
MVSSLALNPDAANLLLSSLSPPGGLSPSVAGASAPLQPVAAILPDGSMTVAVAAGSGPPPSSATISPTPVLLPDGSIAVGASPAGDIGPFIGFLLDLSA